MQNDLDVLRVIGTYGISRQEQEVVVEFMEVLEGLDAHYKKSLLKDVIKTSLHHDLMQQYAGTSV